MYNRKSQAAPEPTGPMEKLCIEDSSVFSDFTIISEEGQEFPCHRLVLAAKSSTMKALMTTEMREKEEKKTNIKYNNQVVGAFVDYFYNGEIPKLVLEGNISSFMELADLYNLDPLKALVEDTAVKNLTLENVVEMFRVAKVYDAKILEKASSLFILENKKILGQQDFSQVPQSVMTELFKLMTQS